MAALLSTPEPDGNATYCLEVNVNACAAAVLQFLLVARNNLKLHPLLIDVQEAGAPDQAHNGATTQLFEFTDRLLLCGCIPTTTKYRARAVGGSCALPPYAACHDMVA